jgi:pyrroline-5-carboxylate reductase
MINKKIGIIGCGNMGEALFSRLADELEKSTSLMVSEMDSARRGYLQGKYRIIVETDNNVVVKYSDVIILAVKPKDVEALLKAEVCCGISKEKLLISVAAGITTAYIEQIVGKDIPVIRAMPNMPAIIGEGISSLSRGSSAGPGDMAVAKEIFSKIGDVVEVDEKLMDAVTATSGSGPAYFCYFIEALTEGAKSLGLDDKTAKRLVMKTALGSVKLLSSLNEDPREMRRKVTSKGGTTEAAIKTLESKKFIEIVKAAVKTAETKSKELSRNV